MYSKRVLIVIPAILDFVSLGASLPVCFTGGTRSSGGPDLNSSAGIMAGMPAAPGPEEHKPHNLKVLPRNIRHDELKKVMEGFKNGLGVKCGFCHAKNASDSTHLDFASDAKPEKDVARGMMKMAMKINRKYFHDSKDDDGKPVTVSCYTCHHGHHDPETFTEVAKN